MVGKYENNPLKLIYDSLRNELLYVKNNSQFKSFPHGKEIGKDGILKFILMNNGCSFSDDCTFSTHDLDFNSNGTVDYKVIYMYNAMANKANEFFDYIEFKGMPTLIVFISY